MSFDFTVKEFILGGGAGTPTFQFYRKGFILNGSGGSSPSWKDIILHGNTALTLVNAKVNGLNYLKLFGGCEQSGTPVIIVYPLAEPKTETVAHQHLGIQAGTNIVEITQASIDNLELEVSYKGTVEEP